MILEVDYIVKNDCFVYISEEKIRSLGSLNSPIGRIIDYEKHKVLFYSPLKSSKECENGKLYINKKFASSVDLKATDTVKVDINSSNLNGLKKVFFKTSDEDYEKLAICAGKLEDEILNQVKCVGQKSTLPIWINKQIFVYITIESLEPPNEFGLLQNNTELHHLPSSKPSKTTTTTSNVDTMFMSLFSNYFNMKELDIDFSNCHSRPKYARICSLGTLKPCIKDGKSISKYSYIVYVNKKSKSNLVLKESSWPVFAFEQLSFKNESHTTIQFLSQIHELDEIKSNISVYETTETREKPNKQSLDEPRNKAESTSQVKSINENTNHVISINERTSQVKSIDERMCQVNRIDESESQVKRTDVITNQIKSKNKNCRKKKRTSEIPVNETKEEISTKENIIENSDDINKNITLTSIQQIVSAEYIEEELEDDLILIYVDQQLLTELNLKVGYKFCLSDYHENYMCEKVILHATSTDTIKLQDIEQIIDIVFERMNGSSKLVLPLNQSSILYLTIKGIRVPLRVELIPNSVQYCCYDTKIRREVRESDEIGKDARKIEPRESEIGSLVNATSFNTETLFLDHLNETVTILVKHIRGSLRGGHICRDNLLVCGPEGSGKTSLCKTLQEALQNAGPDSIHCQVIDCKQMKGKISNVIDKQMRDILASACYMEPACVILDEVNVLCSCSKETLDVAATVLCNKLCALFVGLVREFQTNSNIIIVGVTSSKDIIKTTRAGLVFSHQYLLPALDQINRSVLLEKLIQSKLKPQYFNMKDIDVSKVSKQCEGYSIQDMCDIVDKAMFHYLHKMVDLNPQSSTKPFSSEDLEVAFHSHVPLALKGIKMDTVELINFSHVGGLKSAKQLLVETLVWPSMYPDLFSQCPLKPQSGILLYGAPGTGKTLLASAISGECGLKFISIKGPELFSKFIGESEEGVRNIFSRARRLKPCILFFDEFDSLAAKRGNDSTGVKDRVVNQLLTELDGVEGLDGVYVVGATSRPDIIDPALLRPGRLGCSVHCTVPDEIEREDILRVLTQQVNLSADVDLAEIARFTERFTGADLLGLLCSAQMMLGDADEEDSQEEPEICRADILKALEDTKPSLSVLDSLKFERIYRNFASNKGISSEDMQNQRVISA